MLIPNMIFILHNNWLLIQKGEIYGQNSYFFASDLEKVSFCSNRTILEKSNTCFCSAWEGDFNGVWWSKKSFKMREEIGLQEKWLITSSAYSCRDCATESFCFLWLRSTWLDSVFDGEFEYVHFRNSKRVEGVEISSFLTMMQIFRFFYALRILKFFLRKLDRIQIKRWYSESAQSGVSEYVAFDQKLR
jgi:hypothetical protein